LKILPLIMPIPEGTFNPNVIYNNCFSEDSPRGFILKYPIFIGMPVLEHSRITLHNR
jgi:hypothetical protein